MQREKRKSYGEQKEPVIESPIRYCRPLLASVGKHYSERSYGMIRQALRLAVERLAGRRRYNGEPFVVHSILTALIVADEIGLGRNSVISTLLHDVLRLGLMEMGEVEKLFGRECVVILEGLNQ
ncbi:MAG: HD domain-containing protein, partial [Rikenellaceae bacterium]|nr:HD domain-containing protein [Rikenellaceae bacterium]